LLYWYKSTNTDTQLRAQGLEYQVNVRSYSRYNAAATSTDDSCKNVFMSGAGDRHAGVCKTLRLGVHAQVELLNLLT
jgi:hypothetical protein